MAETETETTETVEPETEETTEETSATDDAKKWQALSRKNEKEKKAALAELEKLRNESLTGQEKAVAEARAEGRAEAMKDANRRLLHAEVRAAAAGVLADPDDAVHLLDLDQFDPDEIDRKAITAALDQLVKAKPYLSPTPGNGSGEGGARGGTTPALGSDPLLAALERQLGTR